jgi:hypothetical protein
MGKAHTGKRAARHDPGGVETWSFKLGLNRGAPRYRAKEKGKRAIDHARQPGPREIFLWLQVFRVRLRHFRHKTNGSQLRLLAHGSSWC